MKDKDLRLNTPLHWACYSGSFKAMIYLMSWMKDPQDINMQDLDGFTPLHIAVKRSSELDTTRPIRSLLLHGANRDIKDHSGKRPIDIID